MDPGEVIRQCPQCGGDNDRHATRCWLCRAGLESAEEIVMAEAVTAVRPPGGPSEWFFAIATVLSIIMVLLVGIGAVSEEPMAGIGYLILVIPPVIATVVRLQHKKARYGFVTWSDRFVALVASAAVTLVVVIGLTAAAFICFFLYCLASLR